MLNGGCVRALGAGPFAVAAATLVVYAPIMSSLVRQWASDANYSHGFIVAPFALYFGWQQRDALARAPRRPSAGGLLFVGASLLVLLAGLLGAELFLTRVSLIGVIAGSIAWLWGWRHVRLLSFAVAFLLLMIPLPALVFNQLAFPLQLLASRAGETVLSLAGVPVLREGNVLVLPSQTLEVAEACSGIRSLVSLLTIGLILGRVGSRSGRVRVALAVLTIPIAILANAARVAGTGLAAEWIGPWAAEGFFHEFSGWVVFMLSVALMLAVDRGLTRRIRGTRVPRYTAAPTRAAGSARWG
jgi:exosortase